MLDINVVMKRKITLICPHDQVGFCPILKNSHFPVASFCTVYAGKSTRHDSNLYGHRSRISGRIFRTLDGGNLKRLAASRTLLVTVADSDANAFLLFRILHDSRVSVSSNRWTSFMRLVALKGPFPDFFWNRNLWTQWSLTPGSRKTTSPTKLYPSQSASLFIYTVYNGELAMD